MKGTRARRPPYRRGQAEEVTISLYDRRSRATLSMSPPSMQGTAVTKYVKSRPGSPCSRQGPCMINCSFPFGPTQERRFPADKQVCSTALTR